MAGFSKAKVVISLAIIFSLGLTGWAFAQEKKFPVARTVTGVVSAVDVPYKALVVEVPHKKKDDPMTVGVTLDDLTRIFMGGKKASLADIRIGDRVSLNYIRTEKQLIAKRINVLSAVKK